MCYESVLEAVFSVTLFQMPLTTSKTKMGIQQKVAHFIEVARESEFILTAAARGPAN